MDMLEFYSEYVSKRVRQLRTGADVSAAELSLSLGYHQSYISKVETGKANPSFGLLINVCEYFKLTPAEFFSGDDDPAYIRQLVETARKMPPDKQKMLLGLLEDMKY